jgi:hypothetical protein
LLGCLVVLFLLVIGAGHKQKAFQSFDQASLYMRYKIFFSTYLQQFTLLASNPIALVLLPATAAAVCACVFKLPAFFRFK